MLAIGVRSVSTLIGSFWPGITGDTHIAAIAARPMVRPSGAALATVSLAMKPLAPALGLDDHVLADLGLQRPRPGCGTAGRRCRPAESRRKSVRRPLILPAPRPASRQGRARRRLPAPNNVLRFILFPP